MPNGRLNTGAWTLQASRNIAVATAVLLAIATPLVTGGAQAVPADSLAARLARAEAAIAVLQAQIAEQAAGGVQTRSRARLELNGRVMMNGFYNSEKVNNVDNPQFALNLGLPQEVSRGTGMAIRQTRLGLAVTVPEVMQGTFTGDVDVDFYGGQLASSGGRTFPLMRLRTARGIVRWSGAHLLVGQESPLINGINPVSPAAIGTPGFATAGNLWLWLPQLRAGVERGGSVRFGVQGAVLAPTGGDGATTFETDNDQAERSRKPFLQARASVRFREESPIEIGCGVHQGWLRPQATDRDSKAFGCDAIAPLTGWLEVRGELFSGEALRGLGGGGIGQNFIPDTTRGLKTKGAWVQLNLQPVQRLSVGAGCGGDHPEQVALLARRRNDACAGYGVVRAGPMFFGAEYRRLRTEYVNRRVTNDHLALVTGFEF